MPRSATQASVREYRPTDAEPFMNERQREYFRAKLVAWREEILKEARETLQHLQDESQNHPDFADRASSETDRAIELRARDRQRKLIAKIDAALQRIEDGTTATARRRASRSVSSASMPARSPRCRSRRRSATSAASASTATTEPARQDAAELSSLLPGCGAVLLPCLGLCSM
jgi:DnaK suppressor protein